MTDRKPPARWWPELASDLELAHARAAAAGLADAALGPMRLAGACPVCGTPTPCPTARALIG